MKNFWTKGAVTLTDLLMVCGLTIATAIITNTINCSITEVGTGMTCEEIRDNPERDIYYSVSEIYYDTDAIWTDAQQEKETVRWDLAHDNFMIKYNAANAPREQMGALKPLNNPMTGAEAVVLVRSSSWADSDLVGEKNKDTKYAEDDNFIKE